MGIIFGESMLYRAGQYYNIIVNRDIKHHNNRYRREIFSIVISVAQYYRRYREYHKIFAQQHPDFVTSVKYFILYYSQFSMLVILLLLAQLISQ